MITKEEALILKAIAIISIIFAHFWGWICPLPELMSTLMSSISQAGVEVFLFLSGYGIMCSYRNSGMKHFWKKRFLKIYIPLLIVTLPQLVIKIWSYRNNIADLYIRSTLLSALGLYPNNLLDGTLWFIPFILLQYIFFYFSFKWTDNRKINYCLLTIGTLLGFFIFHKNFTWVNECDLYAFAFVVGVIYADRNTDKEMRKRYIILFVFLFAVSILFVDIKIGKYINEISLVILEICFVHAVCKVQNSILKILNFLGGISYELFLTEGIFFWNKIIYNVFGYHYVGLFVHLLLIIILSVMIQKISKIISEVLAKRMNKTFRSKESIC